MPIGELAQRFHLGTVRGEHAIEPHQRLGLGATEVRRRSDTIGVPRLQQFERVAVQNEIDRATPFRVHGSEERRKVLRPPEILVGIPPTRPVTPDAHVHITEHDDSA